MGRLQSLFIQGFKTFPDKITLDVHDGVTAVVGPNGSGKSNIAEAMRWVLGEQNARAMRCDKKMEEVIFHGTAQRGALGFAEVSLVLDNKENRFGTDTEQLVITRRLYRSGESEYYINKTGVRLKDLQSLLMDTGLGSGGYSIIRQGMIDRIMSEKPIDRRKIFEEASGIAKYRSRKEEAGRKLILAEQNLQRVDDKIEELKPQAESLARQAETARCFLILRDELRENEINLWMNELDKIRAGKDSLANEFRKSRDACRQGQEALEALVKSAGHMEQQAIELSGQTERQRAALRATEEQLHQVSQASVVAQSDLSHNQERLEALHLTDEQSGSQMNSLQEQMLLQQEHLLAIEGKISHIKNELAALAGQAADLAGGSGGVIKKIDALQSMQGLATAALSEIKLSMSAAAAQKSEWESRLVALNNEGEAQRDVLQSGLEKKENIEQKLNDANSRMNELANVLSGYALRLGSRTKKVVQAKEKQELLRREIHEKESKARILRDLDREYDGNHAVSTVMSGNLPGLHGAVGQLIQVPEELTVAIEIALGQALNHIVVQTEHDAREAIRCLKERNAGRATFYPLTTVNGTEFGEIRGAGSGCEYLGIASRLISCQEQYAGVIRQLLGRTAICRTLGGALELSKRENQRLRIVTLDGQIINAGGSITGGSVGKKVGALSRKNQLVKIESALEGLKDQSEAQDADLAEAERALTAARYDKDVAEQEQRGLQQELAALNAELRSSEEWLKNAHKGKELLHAERVSLENRLKAAQEKEVHSKQEIQTLNDRIAGLEAQASDLSGQGEALRNKQNTLTLRQSELREQLAALTVEKESKEALISDYLERLAELSESETSRHEKQRFYEQEGLRLMELIQEKSDFAKRLKLEIDQNKELIENLSESQLDLERRRNENRRNESAQHEQNQALIRQADKLENSIQSGQREEDDILGKLWEQYELTASNAQRLRTPIEGIAKTKKKIGDIGREIRSLGDVNIKAIEEFEKINERYQYLITQREDAAGSKKELDNIISEITGEMRVLFSGQFERIRQEFASTFTDIFGGGEATLELEEGTDVLESGVEIKARPPGKKLRSISLLSGGEQSLAAIALYFAMFKVRPSPFCVLDEIDHDLDDVNVGRFAAYLGKLAKDTQFVVITHRRGTMERANMLYGVTAQEPGVSKVLALLLSDIPEDAAV